MKTPSHSNLLRSWKEISVHLGVDERTCARWEQKLGMPVHRAEEGMTRSRVFAYKDELDRWFQETFSTVNGNGKADLLGEKRRARRPAVVVAAVALLVVVVAAVHFAIRFLGPGQPVDFQIRGSVLILLAENGREVGRFDTKIDGLESEEFYRALFQSADFDRTQAKLPSLLIRDINADGRQEVLFVIHRRGDAYGEGILYCLDRRAKEMWRYDAGREMRFGGKVYSGDYRIQGLKSGDINNDGHEEIVVIAHHYPDFPCQLSVLNDRGRPIGEYWNSGQLKDIVFGDLNGDGRPMMVVAGINNEYGPCLIVLDPKRVSGCSPQSGRFKSDDLPPGSELYYVVAPRTDVSLALKDLVEGFLQVGVTKSKRISATTQYALIFEFDFGLKCVSVDPGHVYQARHNELLAAGEVRGDVLGPAYAEDLRKGVRYWDGEKLVSTPTPNLRNVRPAK